MKSLFGRHGRRRSMRWQLLAGILLPVIVLVMLNTASLYRDALRSADEAYDRTLLASAKSIGELLEIRGSGPAVQLHSTVPYAALEAFEADNRSRMYYRVTGFAGETVSGYPDLPPWHGSLPAQGAYAALVAFYDDRYAGEPVRVAVLLQPVAGRGGGGMATIQVAETLELRQALARRVLVETAWRQALLVAVIALVVGFVVQRATWPVRELSSRLVARHVDDLSAIAAPDAPAELQPLLEATNQVMARLAHLLQQQKRFLRDTAHQLRTPLTVLRTQVQSARRGDVDALRALAEIEHTVAGATELVNQMLALAEVEHLRSAVAAVNTDWAEVTRSVALDLAPLLAERRLDFSLDVERAPIRAPAWALRELVRNLLHNAIKHTPPGGPLTVSLAHSGSQAVLTIADSGPGLPEARRTRPFEPFADGSGGGQRLRGSGLGLAICHEIVRSLGGRIELVERAGQAGLAGLAGVAGLDAVVRLQLVDNVER